jgi:hypothetical protein
MEKSMISAGLAKRQKQELTEVNGRHPANGTGQTNQYIKRIAAPFLTPDIKPSKLGEHPSLTWLPKILLFVDARYQRQATSRNSLRLIRRMIEEFAWSKFQPITVAEMREGSHSGHYAVIDGQHRAIAAIAHPSVTEVPCWIVSAADLGTQANVFVSVNRDRANIQPLQLYQAQLAARDPDALHIEAVCKAAGVSFALYASGGAINHLPPRQTQAVTTIRRLIAAHGDGPVTASLKALAAAFPETPGQLRGQVIEAVTSVFAKYGDQIDTVHFVAALADRDCDELIEDARKYRKIMRGSTKGAMIAALIQAYNKGMPARSRLARAGRNKSS